LDKEAAAVDDNNNKHDNSNKTTTATTRGAASTTNITKTDDDMKIKITVSCSLMLCNLADKFVSTRLHLHNPNIHCYENLKSHQQYT
jgi:hypothetical protein